MGRQRIGPRARARTRNATTTKSSRARKQPAQWLSAGATTKKNDESSSQLKRLEIKMFCANTRELERLDPKECGAVHAADAVNERAKEVFTLPTAAHFHCEKIPSIRFLIRKNRFNHWEETGAPSKGARKCINERAAWKRSCQTTQKARKAPSIVLARRKATYCEVNLCQFVDAKVVTIELVIVHCAIDC